MTFIKTKSLTNPLLLVLALGPAAEAQTQPAPTPPEEKSLPATFHCGGRGDLRMSPKDKACYWWTNSFNAQMIFGAAFNSALDQWLLNGAKKEDWGKGAEGYSRRFGTRVSQSFAKGTAQALAGAALHEDPRFYASNKSGFGPRLWFAISHTAIVRGDSGGERFAAGRVSGAFASGFVGMAWTPDSLNTPQAALKRSGNALGGALASSLFTEFKPDLVKLASGIFKRPPKETATSSAAIKDRVESVKTRSKR